MLKSLRVHVTPLLKEKTKLEVVTRNGRSENRRRYDRTGRKNKGQGEWERGGRTAVMSRTSVLLISHMTSGSGSPSAVQLRRRVCTSVRVRGTGSVRSEGSSVREGSVHNVREGECA